MDDLYAYKWIDLTRKYCLHARKLSVSNLGVITFSLSVIKVIVQRFSLGEHWSNMFLVEDYKKSVTTSAFASCTFSHKLAIYQVYWPEVLW